MRREPYLRAPLRPRPSIELGLLPRPRPLPLPRPRPPPPLALTPVTRSPSSAASTADALSTAALSPERSAASRAARASASRCRGASVVGGEVEGMGTKGSEGMGTRRQRALVRTQATMPAHPDAARAPSPPRARACTHAHTATHLLKLGVAARAFVPLCLGNAGATSRLASRRLLLLCSRKGHLWRCLAALRALYVRRRGGASPPGCAFCRGGRTFLLRAGLHTRLARKRSCRVFLPSLHHLRREVTRDEPLAATRPRALEATRPARVAHWV